MHTYTQDIEKLLKEGNCIRFKPQGYSMYPVLVPGRDEVIVAPIEEAQTLKRGQVVLYRRYKTNGEKDILVLHRICKVNEQGIYLVGDNQKEVEEKAEYKKSFMPYIVGALILFAASAFAKTLYTWISGIKL